MSERTGIAWCDHTFNSVWGCTKVSAGCKNCYAEMLSERWGRKLWGPNAERRTFGNKHWNEPIAWNAAASKAGVRRRVFCSSMSDVFEDHQTTRDQLPRLFALIRATPHLDWLLLTKRPERILASMQFATGQALPDVQLNLWLGTSIESIEQEQRAWHLRQVPAAVRFISYEPAIGPLRGIDLRGIHWLIYGGESGPDRRPEDPSWARDIRDACRLHGVAFFYKQKSSLRPGVVPKEWDGEQAFPMIDARDVLDRPSGDINGLGGLQ